MPCWEQNSRSNVSSMFVRLRFSRPAAASSNRPNLGVTRKLMAIVRSAVMVPCIKDDHTAGHTTEQEGCPVFGRCEPGVLHGSVVDEGTTCGVPITSRLQRSVRLAHGGLVTPLTDEQWTRVEPQGAGVVGAKGCGTPRRHSLRDLVECMRLKLGTQYSWSKCPGDKSLVQSAVVRLSMLQRAGVWEGVIGATAERQYPGQH